MSSLVISGEPAVSLRKLGSQIFSAPTRLTTARLIRGHGRLVAVRTAGGWQVPDAEGHLTPAGPGRAALYASLAPFEEPSAR